MFKDGCHMVSAGKHKAADKYGLVVRALSSRKYRYLQIFVTKV